MVHPSQQRPPYPRRQTSFCITIARRGRSRAFTVRPLAAVTVLGTLALVVTTVIGAAGFLIYRDDLVGAAISRQVEMQYAYEERIAALRSELDRITSRHFVQSESVEEKLATLLSRQSVIEQRQTKLDTLMEKARASGIAIATAEPRVPRARPAAGGQAAAGTADAGDSVAPLAYMPERPAPGAAITETLLGGGQATRHETLARVQSALDDAQARQSEALGALSTGAEDEMQRLSSALSPIGITVEEDSQTASDADGQQSGPQGGPFIPAPALHFTEQVSALDRMLDGIRSARRAAAAMPLGKPLPALRVSSGFGTRNDPFLQRRAFHSGIDLVAAKGTPVHATAAGVVTTAAWNGGYGLMVEIRHAGGVSTRYGHLSALLVKAGDQVQAGDVVGRVGSTGRSTGAHLHYETRKDDEAVNPGIFFAARRALGAS